MIGKKISAAPTLPQEGSLLVSWETLHRDTRTLAERLREVGTWDALVAVTRGGLIPAAIVARELDIRFVDTICLSSYEGRTRGGLRLLKNPDTALAGKKVLVIDDLVDSGATANAVRELLPNAHIATLYAKPAGLASVDTYLMEVAQESWIVFPWEAE